MTTLQVKIYTNTRKVTTSRTPLSLMRTSDKKPQEFIIILKDKTFLSLIKTSGSWTQWLSVFLLKKGHKKICIIHEILITSISKKVDIWVFVEFDDCCYTVNTRLFKIHIYAKRIRSAVNTKRSVKLILDQKTKQLKLELQNLLLLINSHNY